MITKENIDALLNTMTDDTESNINKIKKLFGTLTYTDDEDQTLLHIFVDNIYNEEKCFLAIKSLLQKGLSPNMPAYYQYNFIQTALYSGYSENFIIKIIEESLKYGLNVNHEDWDFDSMMHTAIYSDDYLGALEQIYLLLCENGFNKHKRNKEGKNLIEAMIEDGKRSDKEINAFISLYEKTFQNKATKKQEESKKLIKDTKPIEKRIPTKEECEELERYGKILNKKEYLSNPTINREKELKNLIVTLANNQKISLIIGPSGVGKKSLVEELVYRINKNNVPDFLKDKIILKVNPHDIISNCEYLGSFEENLKNLMQLCRTYDIILFISDIHSIYKINMEKDRKNEMLSMFRYYLDKSDLKVIGSTKEVEYHKYLASEHIQKRFELISINEPTNEELYQILNKVIHDNFIKYSVCFENNLEKEEIINTIISITQEENRKFNNKVNNPELAISIINKAISISRIYNSEFITKSHVIESLEYITEINEDVIKDAINTLVPSSNKKKKTKSLKLSFMNFRKQK